jgi:transposase-like protein
MDRQLSSASAFKWPMPQHFLLSSEAKTLSLPTIFKLSDEEVEATLRRIRWAATNGSPICPSCQCPDAYHCRRMNGAARFRCRACERDFSITSGTLFASSKLSLRICLAAITIFCNEAKGKSALAMSRDLGLSYKAAFVLCHKLREAMASAMRGRILGGIGKTVEIDGAYFGGYVKPFNDRTKRIDRRLIQNLTGKRKSVIIMRERGGLSLPAVFKSEAASIAFIKRRVRPGTVIFVDEATSWDRLQTRFRLKRINHQHAYSRDGICTNGAEGFFSRLRRGEAGHGHHISGPYLLRYAQEAVFREDERRASNGDQVFSVVALALTAGPSVDFGGYWQRRSSPAPHHLVIS